MISLDYSYDSTLCILKYTVHLTKSSLYELIIIHINIILTASDELGVKGCHRKELPMNVHFYLN